MDRWLYIFAGFPGKSDPPGSLGLHAGGLNHCVENVEGLAELEHDPAIQLRKEGVFLVGKDGEAEWTAELNVVMSPTLYHEGITLDWFPENHWFGNGVTINKTVASPDYRTVVHGTDLTLDEFLAVNGPTRTADLMMERKHHRHDSWEQYEAGWLPGTCPQENHIVYLTWLVTTHKVPEFAYQRLWDIIEGGAALKDPHRYQAENFSTSRRYGGEVYHHAL